MNIVTASFYTTMGQMTKMSQQNKLSDMLGLAYTSTLNLTLKLNPLHVCLGLHYIFLYQEVRLLYSRNKLTFKNLKVILKIQWIFVIFTHRFCHEKL